MRQIIFRALKFFYGSILPVAKFVHSLHYKGVLGMYRVYKNEYGIFKCIEITIRRGLR
jgi:hypothetical protein